MWQTSTFQAQNIAQSEHPLPPQLINLPRFSAGSINIGSDKIDWTFLDNQDLTGQNIDQVVTRPDLKKAIMNALSKIIKRAGSFGLINELSFCLQSQQHGEIAQANTHGLCPVAYSRDESTQEIIEIPSGAIILFPEATNTSKYLGEIDNVSHIAGITAHE